ncbi:outer membrane protein [Asticcacaulis solisilvae]|uniref:outer membrane protein n=1 Tax=Asticcacaulis solisilvae TaxID=1217274 RepID=UPI003FD8D6AE
MKTLIAATAVACLLAAAGSASAADNTWSFSAGALNKIDLDYGSNSTAIHTAYKAGTQFGGAWSSKPQGNWHWDIAVSFSHQDIDRSVYSGAVNHTNTTSGSLKTASFWLDGVYDFPVKGPVKPYAGAGFGGTHVWVDDGVALKGDLQSPGVQVFGGVNVAVSKTVDLFGEARFERLGNFDIEVNGNGSHAELDTSAVVVGLRTRF